MKLFKNQGGQYLQSPQLFFVCLFMNFYLGEDYRIEEKQDSTAPSPGVVERQHLLSKIRHWKDSPLAAKGNKHQKQSWFMKRSKDSNLFSFGQVMLNETDTSIASGMSGQGR